MVCSRGEKMVNDNAVYQPIRLAALAILVLALFLSACTGGKYGGTVGEEDASLQQKIPAEAYSFNARLFVDDKPTTFKLEVYHIDTAMGVYGRGYLGKGALRGRVTEDSLVVYFPSTNEYLAESLTELLESGDCPFPISTISVLNIFRTLPDSLSLDSSVVVEADYGDDNHPEFVVSGLGCEWRIEVDYDRQDEAGWRVRNFEFTDGARYRLWGRLERYKADAKVALERFEPRVPAQAVRITP